MAVTRLGTYSQIKGSSYKLPCKVATSSNISLTGGAPLVVDGYTLTTNDRVLAVSQSTATQNGIYLVQTPGTGNDGTWVRAVDFSLNDDAFEGAQVYITTGSLNSGKSYYISTPDPITLGSTPLSFSQIETTQTITFVVGGGSSVATGEKNNTRVLSPYNGTIVGWKLITDTSSTVILDVWKSTSIPTNSDSITGTAKPSLTSSQFATSSTLTGWTTSISKNDIFIMEVESNNNASYISLSLIVQV